MRRVIIVGAAAIGLGIVAFSRGQFWFGLCFILLGVLRLVGAWWARKPRETEPEIRLNLEEPPASAPGENRPSRP